MNERMTQNQWELIGWVGKQEWARRGQSKNGNPYYSSSISTYVGKNSDGNAKSSYTQFTLWGDLASLGDQIIDGTRLRLVGRPEAKSWMSKDGEVKTELSIIVFEAQILDDTTGSNDITDGFEDIF